MTDHVELTMRERRQAALQNAAGELMALNAQLGISSTLQTTMPTTGGAAWIGVSTGHAVVRIDQLEHLRDRIAELNEALEAWQRADRNGALG